MIVVDTSALIAIVLLEPLADRCAIALDSSNERLISAPTLAETLIVAAGRGVTDQVDALLASAKLTVVPFTESLARQAGDGYLRWGKSFNAAKLNFGDCFAYALAKDRGCPLLFVGDDFSRTDVRSALEEMAPRA